MVLLGLAYGIGPISGCHVNPAVTLGVLGARGIAPAEAGAFVAAQCVGAIAAGGLLRFMVTVGRVPDRTHALGTNSWGLVTDTAGAFTIELVMTAAFVLVILLVTRAGVPAPGMAGLAIGLTLTGMHLIGIPLTGTSVNPARSLGPAVWYWPALSQLWLFIVAPLLGGALAIGLYRALVPTPHPVAGKTLA